MRMCRDIYVVYYSVSVFSSASSLGVRYNSAACVYLIRACSHASCLQMCYSAACCIVFVQSYVLCHQMLVFCRVLQYVACVLVRRFIKWFLLRRPMCRFMRDIICRVLYSAVVYNVFCVPMDGFISTMFCLAFSYVESSCVYNPQKCSRTRRHCSVLFKWIFSGHVELSKDVAAC